MTDATRAREIAEGLRHRQMQALLGFAKFPSLPRGIWDREAVGLEVLGCVTAERNGIANWFWRDITPLGLAVAEILKERT